MTLKYRKKGFFIYCRDPNEIRRSFRVTDFDPYFCISRSESPPQDVNVIGIRRDQIGLKGELLQKIIVESPGDVGRLREDYEEHWESDIPIERRFLVNISTKKYFEAPENTYPSTEPMEISYHDMKGVE